MILWLRLIHWVAARLPLREIPAEDGAIYLRRYRVLGWMPGSKWRGPSIYLHRFMLPDQDTALHNHPYRRAFSVVLSGHYDEIRKSNGASPFWRRVRWVNIIGPADYHRIDRLHGEVWTLFLTWPKSRGWGFWVPGRGHVPWKERLAERGIAS